MSISPTLEQFQRSGFSLGGEPSVALDLVDTVIHAHSDSPRDLLAENGAEWWRLQSGRLPDTGLPAAHATAGLRSALREVIEASIDGRAPRAAALETLNRHAESAVEVPQLELDGYRPRLTTRWSSADADAGSAALAVIARDGMALVADPERSSRLRRCANPTCTMLFLAENSRRVWCAANVCGNRMRVARHQERQREGGRPDASAAQSTPSARSHAASDTVE